MASLQERNGSYRILFKFRGKLHSFTIGRVAADEADSKARQVDYLLMRLKQRLIHLPPGVDIVEFLRHDGSPPASQPTLPESPQKSLTLAHLRDRYLGTLGNGAVEANTLATIRIHLNHLGRILGPGLALADVNLEALQGYVDRRAREKVSAYTIRKEVRTLKAAWAWGGPMQLTRGAVPSEGLRYPKSDEKPPFMTRAEIERQIAGGGSPDLLWDCLYLQSKDVRSLLSYVKARAMHPWIYPAVCFAAHTGARRSEIIRALVADVDFAGNTVLLREKKRRQGQRTTRRVPLTPFLRGVLKAWLKEHPGGHTSSATARSSSAAAPAAARRGTRARRPGPAARPGGRRACAGASGRHCPRSPATKFTTTSSGRSGAASGRSSEASTACGTASSRRARARASTSGWCRSGAGTWTRLLAAATGTCGRRCSNRRLRRCSVELGGTLGSVRKVNTRRLGYAVTGARGT